MQQKKIFFFSPFPQYNKQHDCVFPHMLSNSWSTLKETITTWKCQQMLSIQSLQAYSPLSCTLSSYSYWKPSIHTELQNCQKAGLHGEQVDSFLFLISNQRHLKPQNSVLAHLLTTQYPPATSWQQRIAAFLLFAMQLPRGRCQGLFCRKGSDQTAKPVPLPPGPHTEKSLTQGHPFPIFLPHVIS